VIVDVVEVIVIAGLIVKVASVEVSTTVKESESENVTIARYLNLFIAVVKAAVVKVSVLKPVPFVDPLPLVISIQETEATAVTVSVATCHLTVFTNGEETAVVPTVNESVKPAVVVSFAGCKLIDGLVVKYLIAIKPDPPLPPVEIPYVAPEYAVELAPPPPPPVLVVPETPKSSRPAPPPKDAGPTLETVFDRPAPPPPPARFKEEPVIVEVFPAPPLPGAEIVAELPAALAPPPPPPTNWAPLLRPAPPLEPWPAVPVPPSIEGVA
jgi:hypothetical protein